MARRKSKRRIGAPRRRTSTKTRSRRRHRVGATALNFSASSPLVKYGSALLGFFKPDIIPLEKVVGDKVDGKILAIGEAGIGFLLSQRKKKAGKMGTIMTVLSWYMIGAGVKKSLVQFGIMAGIGPYGRVPVIGRRIAGPYGNVPVIGRFTPNNAMNGYSPSGSLGQKVMCGIDPGSSGYTTDSKGSNYMN